MSFLEKIFGPTPQHLAKADAAVLLLALQELTEEVKGLRRDLAVQNLPEALPAPANGLIAVPTRQSVPSNESGPPAMILRRHPGR